MDNKPILKILFENNDFVIIEKPSGIIVHPWSECADKISILYLLKEQTGKYIYPVHRLDRPVSGVMIFAVSSEAANYLKNNWNDEGTQKIYVGLCKGVLKQAQYISYPLFNKSRTDKQEARTNFWPLDNDDFVTLVLFKLNSGRYHQIRRHAGAMGHQLIGDTKYGKGNFNRYFRETHNLHRLFLHCCGLRIDLGNGPVNFISPPSEELMKTLLGLNFHFNFDESIFDYDSKILGEFSKAKNIVQDGNNY